MLLSAPRRLSVSAGRAVDRSSRNAGRTAGIPRIDPASMPGRDPDRAFPSGHRSACSGFAGSHRSWLAILAHDRHMIPAVVLAAGKSTRMGRTKALLPLGGDTFVSRIVHTFRSAGVEDVVVVVGHDAELVSRALSAMEPAPRVILNPEYETGQLSSILAGLRAID